MSDSNCLSLGISGYKKSGKTTLIEQITPVLVAEGMRLAVVKHQHEAVQTDQPGRDTYRFYQAGADVLGYDGQSVFIKRHQSEELGLDDLLVLLGGDYDLILIEGFKHADIDRIWLLGQGETTAPQEIGNIIGLLVWTDDPAQRLAPTLKLLRQWHKDNLKL